MLIHLDRTAGLINSNKLRSKKGERQKGLPLEPPTFYEPAHGALGGKNLYFLGTKFSVEVFNTVNCISRYVCTEDLDSIKFVLKYSL